MRVWSARRLAVALGALALLGKGARKLRLFLASLLLRLRPALLASGSVGAASASASPASSSVETWRLFSALLRDLQEQTVGRVLLGPDYCIVQAKDGASAYKVLVPPRTENTYILDTLARAGVEFGSIPPSPSRKLVPLLMTLIPFIYLGLTYRMLRGMFGTGTGGGVGKDGSSKAKRASSVSRISFADVAGIDGARKELEEVVDFLRHPARYERIGARVPKGVLLCGPSGTGKTLLARAVASEAGVAFLFCSASDFVEMLVGRGAARVRELFTQAAQHPQCIVFIDEIDALAKARGGLNSNDEREQTLNQLLTEMDGFEGSSNSGGVIVIAATNRPEVLDPALCRPGRFDRHVYVGLPDARGREEILRVHCRGVRLDEDVRLAEVADECAHYGQRSGAQLASMVNEAALLAVRHGSATVKHAHLQLAMARAYEAQAKSLTGSFVELDLA